MIITRSILAGLLSGWLWYRVLFYDSTDFWSGCYKFAAGLGRRRRQPEPPPPPEHFEDEGWSSGFRFLIFVAALFGCGYLVYYELQKHFD